MSATNRNDLLPDKLGNSSPTEQIPIAPLLLDESQAAALLSLSQRKLWELAARGAVKSVKIGALKRYRRIDLEAWVTSGCPTE